MPTEISRPITAISSSSLIDPSYFFRRIHPKRSTSCTGVCAAASLRDWAAAGGGGGGGGGGCRLHAQSTLARGPCQCRWNLRACTAGYLGIIGRGLGLLGFAAMIKCLARARQVSLLAVWNVAKADLWGLIRYQVACTQRSDDRVFNTVDGGEGSLPYAGGVVVADSAGSENAADERVEMSNFLPAGRWGGYREMWFEGRRFCLLCICLLCICLLECICLENVSSCCLKLARL